MKDSSIDPRVTHGLSRSRVYNIWAMMRQRCNNPNAPNYLQYGGAGVQCCERWALFENFYADMGDPPSQLHTLDRIDSKGHYTPENCRWADVETQQNNRSSVVWVTAFGETLTMTQWARKTGIPITRLQHRFRVLKMDPEKALTMSKGSWNLKRVKRTNMDGSAPVWYDSVAEAAKKNNVVKGSLWAYLKKGTGRGFSGFLWEYDNSEE